MASKLLKRARLAFIRWLARRLPACRDLAPLISQSLDRRLSLRERLVVRLHLYTCSYCVKYLRQLRLMSAAFRACDALAEDGPRGPALDADSRQRLKDALKRAAP